MKFKIHSKRDNGDVVCHVYDNITQDICTEEGVSVFLHKDPRCEGLVYSQETKQRRTHSLPLYKKPKSRQLRITLGYACNFKCKYCAQAVVRNKSDCDRKTIPIHEDLRHKVNKLVERIRRANITTEHISLWGGEPFVYLKTMKLLVPKLREVYGDTPIGVITNGSLLTRDTVQWLIDNRVGLTISHDGPSFSKYRDDLNPLEDLEILSNIKYYMDNIQPTMKCNFNIVVTSDNCDFAQVYKYFTDIFNKPVDIHFESIAKLDTLSKDIITPFDETTTKTLMNNLVAVGSTQDDKHPFWSIRDKVTRLMETIVNRMSMKDCIGYCNVINSRFIAIDMNGNLLRCHGGTEAYGTLESIDSTPYPLDHMWSNREGCAECPVLASCKGGCVIATDENHKIACENLKLWHSGIFIAAWKLLFGSTVFRIEPFEG